MSRRDIQPIAASAVAGVRAEFEDEGRSIGRYLYRKLLADASARAPAAETPSPSTREAPTVRELDPAALVTLQSERLLHAPTDDELADVAALPAGSFRNQRSMAFTNNGADRPSGLALWFDSPVTVFIDPATGNAGPFQDIVGNGTAHLRVTNPTRAIRITSTVQLKLRSNQTIDVREWGWLRDTSDSG